MINFIMYRISLYIILTMSFLPLFLYLCPELCIKLIEYYNFNICDRNIKKWLYIENILYIITTIICVLYLVYYFIQRIARQRYIQIPSFMYPWTKFSYIAHVIFLYNCGIYLTWLSYVFICESCNLGIIEYEDIQHTIKKARHTKTFFIILYILITLV